MPTCWQRPSKMQSKMVLSSTYIEVRVQTSRGFYRPFTSLLQRSLLHKPKQVMQDKPSYPAIAENILQMLRTRLPSKVSDAALLQACFDLSPITEMHKMTGGVIQNITTPSHRYVLYSYVYSSVSYPSILYSSGSPVSVDMEQDGLEVVVPLPGGSRRRTDREDVVEALPKSSGRQGKKV